MISEGEWASIRALIMRLQPSQQFFITGKVIKRDSHKKLVWIKELGDQPIPVVSFDSKVKQYDSVISAVDSVAVATPALTGTPSLTGTATPTVTTRPPTRTILRSGSGTYNRPANCIAILVEAVAGGGGGAGSAAGGTNSLAMGGPGSGGQYAASLISSPAASYAYTVGGGGNGGAAGANAGADGSDTTFGSVIVAKGGKGATTTLGGGGTPAIAQSGGTPAAGTGDLVLMGGDGVSVRLSGISGYSMMCAGGGPLGGKESRFVITGATQGGFYDGSEPGQGGSGALDNAATARRGGNGGPGLLVITEFYATSATVDVSIDGSVSIGGTIDVDVTSTATGEVNLKSSSAPPSVPKIGERVLVALEMGAQNLPRCLGVIQGRGWIVSEVEN